MTERRAILSSRCLFAEAAFAEAAASASGLARALLLGPLTRLVRALGLLLLLPRGGLRGCVHVLRGSCRKHQIACYWHD